MSSHNTNVVGQQQNEETERVHEMSTNSSDNFISMEEENLSGRMSQLSTHVNNTNPHLLKEIKAKINTIPNYLTKRSTFFNEIIDQILAQIKLETIDMEDDNNNNDDNIDNRDELRKIAILIYKIMVVQTYQILWAAYLKSGLGELITSPQTKLPYSTNLPIWHREMKTILCSNDREKVNGNKSYLELVENQLDALQHQLKQNQIELDIHANKFQGYSLAIQNIIRTYIEQNLQSLRMEIEHKIVLIEYDYHMQALKLEYHKINPNTFQKKLMKEFCKSSSEQETAEQEVTFLKQQIDSYKTFTQSFDYLPIAQNPLIDSIQNANVRQQLYQQYAEIAEQSRIKVFTLYMKAAEEQREEYKAKHKTIYQKVQNAYRSSSDTLKISTKMLDLINRRSMKIIERIKCDYKFKIQSNGLPN